MHAAPASPGLLIYRIKRTVKFGNPRLVRLVVEVIVQILGIEQEFVPVPGIDRLCRLLAARGRLTAEMLDVYLAAGRITPEQYTELIAGIGE